MVLWLLLTACSGGQTTPAEPSVPTEPPPAPAAPAPAPTVPPAAATVLELDAAGGGAGAPAGVNFILPAGVDAEAVAGPLSDGSKGFRLTARTPGDALVCTGALDAAGQVGVKLRMAVKGLVAGPQDWNGLTVELRPRDAAGALVSPPGARYVTVQNLRADLDWTEVSGQASLPAGAVKTEVCVRFVQSSGTVEVDRIEIAGAGGSGGAEEVRYDLDLPGGGAGAPMGAEFFLPPGTAGVRTNVGDVGGAKGFALEVDSPANALVCTKPYATGGKVTARGRVRVRAVDAKGGPYQGFTAEVRSYGAGGALVPGVGSQYTPLRVWKEAVDWEEWEVAYSAPPGAATDKVCFRFVEATGKADVDWVAVLAAPGAVPAAPPAGQDGVAGAP